MSSTLALPAVVLPVEDYDFLQALARSLAEQLHPLASPLSHELRRAEWREAADDQGQTVSLDRFVTFRVGGARDFDRRLLIDPADGMWPAAELSVVTPVGITLLGLSAGDRMRMIGADIDAPPWLEVVEVGPAATSGIVRQRFPSITSR